MQPTEVVPRIILIRPRMSCGGVFYCPHVVWTIGRKDKRMALKEELEGLRDETLAAISKAETSDALE